MHGTVPKINGGKEEICASVFLKASWLGYSGCCTTGNLRHEVGDQGAETALLLATFTSWLATARTDTVERRDRLGATKPLQREPTRLDMAVNKAIACVALQHAPATGVVWGGATHMDESRVHIA